MEAMTSSGAELLLLHNAFIVTMDPQSRVFRDGAIVVNGDKITAIGQSSDILRQFSPFSHQIIDLHGQYVLPGFINTHVHTSQQLARGIADDVDLMTWLHHRIWPYESNMTEEDSYISTLLCGIELIHSGVTCFAEAGGQHVSGMARAVELLGLRACLTQSIMDSGKGLPEYWGNRTTDDCIQTQKKLHEKHHNTADGRIRIWLGIRQIMNSSDRLLTETRDMAKELKTGIHMHARILDPLLSYPSTILGREKAIVLNLEHIKAIITADEVLLRDPLDDNIIPVVEELRRRLPLVKAIQEGQEDGKELGGQHDADAGEEDESPFEFRALEVALEAICSFLAARTTELETAAYPALDELTSKISSRNLDRVRKLKSAMTRLTARVQKVRDELEQLLDDDDDMADLYLSRKLAGASSPVSGSGAANWFPASPTIGSKISKASRASLATVRGDENDVEELEMLLEAYFMQIDGTLNKLTTLREYIDDTEDYINIQLDNHRNQLIQLELFLSSGTVCLSIYSLVAGIFGMNIPYTWNDNHGYMFKWVVIFAGAVSAILFVLIISYARYKGLVGS